MSETEGASQNIDEFLGSDARPRWRRTAIIWVPALLLVLAVVAIVIFTRGRNKTEYVTEPVAQHSLDIDVTATGNLRPTNQVEVGSEISGRIDDIYVDVNDHVTRGELLARINTDVIDDNITQQKANLNSALASVEQAKATLQYDQAQLDRQQQVWKVSGGKVPSKSELEVAEANVTRDKASLASAQASVTSSRAALSSAETQRSRAIIRSPVSGVVLARQVEPGQTVAASFNTPTLFVIAQDLSKMQLRVSIDEADVGQVKAGQKATFTVDAYPGRKFPATVERVDLASSNTAATAASSSSSSTTSSVVDYEARLTVSNPDGVLRPGMTATASIATESTGVQLLVPNGALRFKPAEEEKAASSGPGLRVRIGGLERGKEQATIGPGSHQTVYVLEPDGKTLKPYPVVTGQSNGKLTVVTDTKLAKGMNVVTGIRANSKGS
jgi:HlyD family secretion protein